mgnify:CR=1 FL=1
MVYQGPKQLEIQETDDFKINNGQLRIETICSGISHGTEMSIYRGVAPFFKRTRDSRYGIFRNADEQEKWTYPVKSCDPGVWYMGYANVGRVIEAGPEVKNVKVGDVVYSNAPHQSHVIKTEDEVIKIPKGVKNENAVVFTNLLTAFNGILDSRIKLGDTVVISGLGVLGQLVSQMVKMSGAFRVIGVDVIPKRLEAAHENGTDIVLNASEYEDAALEVRKLTHGKGADLVIDVSGNHQALNSAIRMAGNDTVVTALGWYQGYCDKLNLSEEFHHNRITLRSSQTCMIDPAISQMWNDERKKETCIELLSKLKIDNLITYRIPFEDAAKAYELIDLHPEELIQVILTY